MKDTYAVILAGGKGERFWPLSRKDHPKQLLAIGTKKTLIEESVRGISSLIPSENIFIVTNQNLKRKIEGLLPEIPHENIVGEPVGRNTAPAIGLGTILIQSKNRNAVIVVLTADHIIKEEKKFLKVIKKGTEVAQKQEYIVTIGIKPTRPETAYGYIKPSEKILEESNVEIFKVDKFVEKPDIEKAKECTKKGYLWNSGMFIFKASTMINAISKHMPSLYEGLMKIRESLATNREEQVLREVYENIKAESIDYGVMEKTEKVYVIKGNFKWSDMGSWSALGDIYPKDGRGNVKMGKTIEIDTKNSILVGENRLIATVGVEDIIVVETDDAVLVCHKDKAQKVKDLVRKIDN